MTLSTALCTLTGRLCRQPLDSRAAGPGIRRARPWRRYEPGYRACLRPRGLPAGDAQPPGLPVTGCPVTRSSPAAIWYQGPGKASRRRSCCPGTPRCGPLPCSPRRTARQPPSCTRRPPHRKGLIRRQRPQADRPHYRSHTRDQPAIDASHRARDTRSTPAGDKVQSPCSLSSCPPLPRTISAGRLDARPISRLTTDEIAEVRRVLVKMIDL